MNLMHEGLLELSVLTIKTRNKMQELEKDTEIEMWKDELDGYATDLNEVLSRVYEMLGCVTGFRLERENDGKEKAML